ncbi:hypothetical protein PIIN_11549 [Serendipita indica DSM 11827]|uniref:Zn(2)-C6 fungal-type domain-containing protein n=1 Tax=Serendipita indica (strain DSM 11827) TaxID=1109443 RepID=G4U1X9_SERID|nr:hypothetical protein PIIN_11549 [Serendipita indica DSM 11827]
MSTACDECRSSKIKCTTHSNSQRRDACILSRHVCSRITGSPLEDGSLDVVDVNNLQ